MENIQNIIDTYNAVIGLKNLERTGWKNLKVQNPESVASHTFGVAFLAVLLDKNLPEGVDKEKLLTLCIIHDIQEALCGDKTPQEISKEEKFELELKAINELSEIFGENELKELWLEYEECKTIESQIAADLDRIDMFLQLHEYKKMPNLNIENMKQFEKSEASYQMRTDIGKRLLNQIRK